MKLVELAYAEGISVPRARERRALARLPEAEQEAVRSGEKTPAEALRGNMRARSHKSRGRPLAAKTLAIRDAIDDLTRRFDRMTVRQIYYAAEVLGIVPKTETGGYRPVQRQVLKMRREGLLDWDFITDGTRWQRKPNSYDNASDYIEQVSRSYRRDLWQGHDLRIEIWLEKDALADLVVDVTNRWDVSLMVSRGQSSTTYLHSAAMAAQDAYERAMIETYIYTLYDFDAAGERTHNTITNELPTHAPETPIYVERLAVTPEQIVEWELLTRPPKEEDPDAKKWGDKPAVELDAIDPDRLTALVEDAITQHIDEEAWLIEQGRVS